MIRAETEENAVKRIFLLLSAGLSLVASPAVMASDAPLNLGQSAKVQQAAPPVVQAVPRLVMLPFENHLKDQDPAIARSALDAFQVELLKPQGKTFRLLDQRHVSAKIKELALSEQGLAESDQALELGRQLDAGLLLSGNVAAGKIHTSEVTRRQPTKYTWATIQVHVDVTDVETGEVLFSGEATGKSGEYPTWKSDRFTSLILEAVAAAAKDLAAQVMLAQAQRE
jgi:hypothetical protein